MLIKDIIKIFQFSRILTQMDFQVPLLSTKLFHLWTKKRLLMFVVEMRKRKE